jgi:hypothetical protein
MKSRAPISVPARAGAEVLAPDLAGEEPLADLEVGAAQAGDDLVGAHADALGEAEDQVVDPGDHALRGEL